MKKRYIDIISLISAIGIMVFLALCVGFYYDIIKPSYFSYKIACFPENAEQILNDNNYQISGSYNIENNTIQIYDESNCEQISKHELCHQQQAFDNRIGSCSKPLSIFLNEIECYIKEKI